MTVLRIHSLFLLLLMATLLWSNNEAEEASNDILSWDVLAKVETVEKDLLMIPKFSEDIKALDGQVIQLRGYIMPLDQAKEQKHFVLSANPVAGCYFCVPGGPESMVEVKAKKKVKFGYNPITISGTLELLADDPMGMYYRLTDAQLVE